MMYFRTHENSEVRVWSWTNSRITKFAAAFLRCLHYICRTTVVFFFFEEIKLGGLSKIIIADEYNDPKKIFVAEV